MILTPLTLNLLTLNLLILTLLTLNSDMDLLWRDPSDLNSADFYSCDIYPSYLDPSDFELSDLHPTECTVINTILLNFLNPLTLNPLTSSLLTLFPGLLWYVVTANTSSTRQWPSETKASALLRNLSGPTTPPYTASGRVTALSRSSKTSRNRNPSSQTSELKVGRGNEHCNLSMG